MESKEGDHKDESSVARTVEVLALIVEVDED